MSTAAATPLRTPASFYFVVMLSFGSYGQEAIVDPTLTRDGVIARIADGNYPADNITFIHRVSGAVVTDVTDEMIEAASDVREAA